MNCVYLIIMMNTDLTSFKIYLYWETGRKEKCVCMCVERGTGLGSGGMKKTYKLQFQ